MDTLSRNQHSSIEASQTGWLFGDGLENGDRDGDLRGGPARWNERRKLGLHDYELCQGS